MTHPSLTFSLLPDVFAIARLETSAPLPGWAMRGKFWNISRTADELSVVCAEGQVPAGVTCNKGWRCFKLEGPLDLALTGIAAAITVPLAAAGINVFCLATYDTDYFLVRSDKVGEATAALTASGHHSNSPVDAT